jgi:cation diffusion facilitator CzcD-associated flavoprotein CzcO
MSCFSSAATSLEKFTAGGSLHGTSMSKVKRIAIIGAGPAGAISIDAFAQEQAFDIIRVFERRERPGGCW